MKIHTGYNINTLESIITQPHYTVTNTEQLVLIKGIVQLQGDAFMDAVRLKSLHRSSLNVIVAMRLVQERDDYTLPITSPDYNTVVELADAVHVNRVDLANDSSPFTSARLGRSSYRLTNLDLGLLGVKLTGKIINTNLTNLGCDLPYTDVVNISLNDDNIIFIDNQIGGSCYIVI